MGITLSQSESLLDRAFSNIGEPRAIIMVNILRIENGLLVEHWDVIEKEVTKEESKSGLPMFKNYFAH